LPWPALNGLKTSKPYTAPYSCFNLQDVMFTISFLPCVSGFRFSKIRFLIQSQSNPLKLYRTNQRTESRTRIDFKISRMAIQKLGRRLYVGRITEICQSPHSFSSLNRVFLQIDESPTSFRLFLINQNTAVLNLRFQLNLEVVVTRFNDHVRCF
jgi:hypothetical protein